MAFSAIITINSVNVTADLTGIITISAVEAAARTARFTLDLPAGNIAPYSYIGQSVTIDYVEGTTNRLFTGIVHLPEYNITTGLLTLACTDNLQESVELISRASIDALLPGYYDDAIFNKPEENWTYAENIMLTYPGSYDLDVNGVSRVTDWLPKVTPDYTLTDNQIIDDTLTVSLARRRNIINSIKVSFANRFQRQWQRELSDNWSIGVTWDAWLANTFELPQKSTVEGAAKGWTVKNLSYTDLPGSGDYSGFNWFLSDYAKTLCQGAFVEMAKRWVQNVTNNYVITVQSAASITQHGLLQVEENYSHTAEVDDDYLDFSEYKAPTGSLIETGNYIALTEDSANNAVLTAINKAKTKILDSHRQNTVTFQALLNPDFDTDKTIRVNHSKAQVTGKVSAITHVIDFDAGQATTECTLSAYLPNITLQTDDALTVPASPYVAPSGLTTTMPGLSTYLGNITGAAVQDADWNGWIANYDNWSGTPPAPEFYSTGFTIELPEVTDTIAEEFTVNASYNIAIPENELIIIK